MTTPLYSPLKEEDFEVRILDILPATDLEEPIICEFRIVSLTAKSLPLYTALSYTWGDAKHSCNIFVDGTECRVSINLAFALRHLRSQKETESVWADALCINQMNVSEKTAQLFIMEDIYKDAEKVLVWLGEPSEDSDLAMRAIERWSAWKDQPLQNMESSADVQISSDKDETSSTAASEAIRNLLRRPYWTRVWIQQEVALPRVVYVQCGQLRVPFSRFVEANESWEIFRRRIVKNSKYFRKWTNLTVPDVNVVAPLENLIRLRQHQRTIISTSAPADVENIPLFEFLRSYQHLKSTDPRDRIYALLGLYSPLFKYRSKISPSYTHPLHKVFCTVAKVMIEDENSLRPVALAGNIASRSPVAHLPSWVPDWTGVECLMPLHLHQEGNHGAEIRLDLHKNTHISENGLILSVRGTVCDVVSVL